jgi:hypothetical protein
MVVSLFGAGSVAGTIPLAVSPEDYGAVGDGTSDDTGPVNVAIATGLRVDGRNKTYAVSSNIALPATCRMSNIEFKDLAPSRANCRVLDGSAGGTVWEFRNVRVNRNGDGTGGAIGSTAGMWLIGCPKLILDECEVYGNNKGNGIVTDCDYAYITRPYIHDMRAGNSSSAAFTDDQLQGLWVLGGTHVEIISPRIENLTVQWNGQAEFARFTRGLSTAGVSDLSILDPHIDLVDQGIDITGDENPTRISVKGGSVSNCYSYSVKCANSVTYANFVGVISYRSGNSAFVASAPSSALAKMTSVIEYHACMALETGYGSNWTAIANVSAFKSEQAGTVTNYPRTVRYIGCVSDANGAPTEYGFFNDAVLSGSGDTWVEAINCSSIGHTVDDYFGLHQGLVQKNRNSNFSVAYNAWSDISWDQTLIDRCGATTANAWEVKILRAGVYFVAVDLEFVAAAGGTRGVRVQRNGTTVIGGQNLIPVVAGSAMYPQVGVPVPCDVNDILKVQGFQDQTAAAALNISTGSGITVSLMNPNQNR